MDGRTWLIPTVAAIGYLPFASCMTDVVLQMKATVVL